MGFNNQGVDVAAVRLRARNGNIIIGGNIGKNKLTPNENAVDDYLYCFNSLYDCVDYFTVNVSSPNTPGLRELQDKEPLRQLLRAVMEARQKKADSTGMTRPVFLKIAPDMDTAQLDEVAEIVLETGLEGVIATNTTVDRGGLLSSALEIEKAGNGGLSGRPLEKKSTGVIAHLAKVSGSKFGIIGVGGISSADDAKRKLDAGASLVQLYTGFIYKGPGVVKAIKKGI
jgi:dihydroorotate dehydrogenase